MYRSDPRPQVDCSTMPSKTRQSEKQSCDINFIVRQYRKTGQIAHMKLGIPQYADVSEVGDFRGAMERVRTATEYFEHLPAKVRDHFGNSPAAFLDAATDPSRIPELEKLGLVAKKEPAPKVEPAPAQ